MKRLLLLLLFTSSALAEPTITSIEPSSAPASGGVFVHIYGTDLTGFALACPSIECANYVKFGDVLGGIAVNTDTEIVALAPPHATGTVDLTVNIAGKKKIMLPAAFTFEDSTTYERLLLPVVVSNAPGAFGSIWSTEALLSNNSDAAVSIQNVVIQPHQTVPLPAANEPNGVFLLVPRGDIDVQLRVRDLSREAQTFGTSIPVVRTTDFRPIVRIHGVPTDSHFRSTLRIYDYPGESGPVRLQIFDEATGALLVSNTVTAFTQQVPAVAGHDRVRIEVGSTVDPPQPVWAFVSVTNNETQHVTVIAPAP